MERGVKILIIFLVLFGIIGTVLGVIYYDKAHTCPECDDGNNCTIDTCTDEFDCSYEVLDPCVGDGLCEYLEYGESLDCPSCDDEDICTEDVFNFDLQKCFHFKQVPCNGNNICEIGEWGNSTDCPDCNDLDDCTADGYNYAKDECIHNMVFNCCGNGRCESGETFVKCNYDCVPTAPEVDIVCGSNETCKIGFARRFKEIDACFSTMTREFANECIKEVAIGLKNISVCKLSFERKEYHEKWGLWTDQYVDIKKDIDVCEEAVILDSENESFCEQYLTYPNKCYEKVAIRDRDSEICNLIIEEENFFKTRDDFVLKCNAKVMDDVTICKTINQVWLADDCVTQLAIQMNNTGLCEAHSTPGECELEIMEKLET